ncbi:YcjF family protein [Nodosilinea sp. PGN35]|uniref:YcjF family protein n=1 Tax=Nodosilinea sp. PGN35 TaxID=3020489 RepID=UPI0023B2DFC0|nr:GTP-binding protein [Nodosilinea sp. TSF1-S3]MDF0369213.1 GTP-binding protein [Nodosilinea sp. TSF1-S3]
MVRWQWVFLPLGILVGLGALLLLADALLRLYNLLALVSPLLAQVTVGIVAAVGLGAAGFGIYRLWPFLRPRRRRRQVQAPRRSEDAAAVNLLAIQRQVEQIQDHVARQALQQKALDLQAASTARPLTIAVFGVGSAGKTALINGLLGEPLGAVGAAMGTTQEPQSYPWAFPNSPKVLQMIDTPGIAEAGVAGTEREATARQIATAADLILFVVDDDLRQAEFTVLSTLMEMGKRVLVVLNKADRYVEADLDALLDHLRSRLVPPLSADDVVAVAALPQPLPRVGGGWLQMQPNLLPLQTRLADLLRQEGETLMADNLLLQTQQIGDAARQLIDDQRQTQAEAIIDRYQWLGAGAIAMTPLPGLDFLATAAINAQMVVELSQVYGCEVSLEEGKALALSVAKTLTGLGFVKGTLDLLALGLQTNLATVVAGRALKGASGAYLTRIAGKSFVEYFRQNQSWGDSGMGAVVEQQYRLNQRDALMKAFVKEAVTRIVPIVQGS